MLLTKLANGCEDVLGILWVKADALPRCPLLAVMVDAADVGVGAPLVGVGVDDHRVAVGAVLCANHSQVGSFQVLADILYVDSHSLLLCCSYKHSLLCTYLDAQRVML